MKLKPGINVAPGTSRQNKTGSWRNFYPKYDHDKCTGCGTCAIYCPEGCIYGNLKLKYHPDLDFCKGCGICANVCPVKCIEMVLEVR